MTDRKLSEVFDVAFLQKFQEAFSYSTGMASIITDLEGPVTAPSNFTRFCDRLTRQSEKGNERCVRCDLQGGQESTKSGRPSVYYCHAGLMDFAAPIIVDGKQIGSILGGQVLTEPPDEEKFKKIAVEIGIDPDVYIEALREVKIVPEIQVRQAAELLYITISEISKVQTQYLRLENSHEVIQSDVDYINEQVKYYADAVDGLSTEQSQLLEQLISLNQVTGNVNKIVNVVARVSKNIKLISLNASVEAARSGQSGKGFAVIAQEIRKLADETSKTVNQIEAYTTEILEATRQVLEISTGSTKSLDLQVQRLETIFPRLDSIIAEISNLHEEAV